MRLTCQRESLSQAFQIVAAVAPARSPKPILSNVRLDAAAEGCTLLATDLEIGVRLDVPGIEVEAPGSVLLPIGRFGPILRESTDEKLVLESDGQKTLVRGQFSEFNLPSENPQEFPSVATFNESKYFEIGGAFFREAVRRTVFATDPESSRYALGGVLLELGAGSLTAVATDGRRLAKQEGPANPAGGAEPSDRMTIVPTRAMQVIERALGACEGDVHLAVRENDILLKCGRTMIYSRLVEGRFPRWRDVVPQRSDGIRVELTVGPFYGAVRQAAIVTSEARRGVEVRFGDGKVVLSGHGAELGESRIELPIAYEGSPVPVNLDPRYLADFLRVLDAGKQITVELRDPDAAVLFTTDDGYSYVVMPLARDQGA